MKRALKAVQLDSLPLQFQAKRSDLGPATEFKALPMEIKVDTAKRRVEGWAAAYGNIDHGGDRIMVGAAAKTIAERMPKSGIKFLWDHFEPIGMPEALEEHSEGLFAVGKINDHKDFDRYVSLIDQGVAQHLSIGFNAVRSDFVEEGKDEDGPGKMIREIHEYKLYEYSAVLWPMNELAEITAVKHATIERGLRELGLAMRSVRLAKALMSVDALRGNDAAVAAEILEEIKSCSESLALEIPQETPEPETATTSHLAPSAEELAMLRKSILGLQSITGQYA